MKITKRFKDLSSIFIGQFLVYGIVIVNTRSFTKDQYLMTALSDILLAGINFYIIRKITKAEDEDKLSMLFYVMGGTIGSLVFMYISKHFLNV